MAQLKNLLFVSKRKSDDGASLVEFAFVMPFLLILILGIVEFGFMLGQFNEVRHGAHEGARLAAVDDDDLINNTCNGIGLSSDVDVTFVDGATGSIGEQASVTIAAQVSSLSGLGMIEAFLPDVLSTTADFKLEQPSDNWTDGTTSCP
jgi:Flp pilus assembly protein TadG